MTGQEFIRKLKELGNKKGILVKLVHRRGKGSHISVFYRKAFSIVSDIKHELKTGTLHAILQRLGLNLDDLLGFFMEQFIYPIQLTPDEKDGGFVVQFVDFPEAITQGEDMADALAAASDCLEEAVVNRIVMGLHIPKPSPQKRNSS
jgi:predicted RNase H-like HicB family nuclease